MTLGGSVLLLGRGRLNLGLSTYSMAALSFIKRFISELIVLIFIDLLRLSPASGIFRSPCFVSCRSFDRTYLSDLVWAQPFMDWVAESCAQFEFCFDMVPSTLMDGRLD